MSNRALLKGLFVAGAIVAVAMVLWQSLRANAPPADAATAAIAQAPEIPTATDAPAAPKPRPASGPLPDLGAPLGLVIDDLQRRAAAGEAPSACRLAAEFSHCDQLRYRRADAERWLAERKQALSLITDPEAVRNASASIDREMALRERRIEALAKHCEGVTLPDAAQQSRQWRQAALLGSRSAMRQYASGNAFRWNSLMSSLPELTAYRNEAERMATTLAREGDVEMTLALASGYDPMPSNNRSLLAQTLTADGARALALYRRLLQSLDGLEDRPQAQLRRQVEARVELLEASLAPEEGARAEALMSGELATWSPPAVNGDLPGRALGSMADVGRAGCARD
jgi:hypothetical protein